VGAVSEEKWAVILWLRRLCWRDACPRGCDIIEDYPPTLTPNANHLYSHHHRRRHARPHAQRGLCIPLAIILTIVPTSTVSATITRFARLPLLPQIANAAYIAPISPRPLPMNMHQHSTTQGRQFKPMDVPRNDDLVEL
jgi:hypothetical protein